MDSDAAVSAILDTPAYDAFRLSAQEEQLLRLWEQLHELALERAILSAHAVAVASDADTTPALTPEQATQEIQQAELALLEARASYALRNKIVAQALVADPILKAVHESRAASPLDQRLRPLVHERDALAMLHAHLARVAAEARARLYRAEAGFVAESAANRALAAEMLELAQRTRMDVTPQQVPDESMRAQMEQVRRELRLVKSRYLSMKGLVRGIVVASGIDWVRAEEGKWKDVVLDREDDGG